MVEGDSGEYTVEIEIDKKSGELTFECDCYFADEGNFCKHMFAALTADTARMSARSRTWQAAKRYSLRIWSRRRNTTLS